MKHLYSLFIFIGLFGFNGKSQPYTAMDFTQTDCDGNAHELFPDLDAGHAVVLFFYMPNCGTCIPPAENIQAMANKINITCPNMVKGYAFSYLNSTTCAYTSSWVSGNGLPFYAPMDDGETQLANYGGFGMPTIVLLGGANRDVLFVTQNWVDSDTTTMRDLILDLPCLLDLNEEQVLETEVNVYPNPAHQEVFVSFLATQGANISAEIQDVTGRTVLNKVDLSVSDGKVNHSFNVSDLPDGNYLMKIDIDGKVKTEKVLVRH